MYSGADRDRRRRRDDDEDSGIIERVVQIRRVAKVVKGGGNLSFTALVVVGDGKGQVGVGLGKAKAVPDAIRKGTTIARKDMAPIVLKDTTVPHEVFVKFCGAKVLLKPAAPGAGIIAGGGVRAVMEASGVKDVLSKTFGSNNKINIVKATVQGLRSLRDPAAARARRLGTPVPVAEGEGS